MPASSLPLHRLAKGPWNIPVGVNKASNLGVQREAISSARSPGHFPRPPPCAKRRTKQALFAGWEAV